MCSPGQLSVPASAAGAPASAAEAAEMVRAGLAWLASADTASLPVAVQADCLLALERAESARTAASASLLRTFAAAGGPELDGHGSARTWLRWRARITRGAAAGAAGWARRLAAHPAVADALAGAGVSPSWARQVCDWTDLLPAGNREDADQVLLAAAAGGAELADLAALAEEIRSRTAPPDRDGGAGPQDGFADRWADLDRTFGGTGSLAGGLTGSCAAALDAVLGSLGQRRGPEDTRTARQLRHDAIEDACLRLLGSGGLPDRAGQPVHLQLFMTLDQLRGETAAGTAAAERARAWAAAAGGGALAGPGDDCDAAVIPVVTGTIDHQLLDRLATALLTRQPGGSAWAGQPWAGW